MLLLLLTNNNHLGRLSKGGSFELLSSFQVSWFQFQFNHLYLFLTTWPWVFYFKRDSMCKENSMEPDFISKVILNGWVVWLRRYCMCWIEFIIWKCHSICHSKENIWSRDSLDLKLKHIYLTSILIIGTHFHISMFGPSRPFQQMMHMDRLLTIFL